MKGGLKWRVIVGIAGERVKKKPSNSYVVRYWLLGALAVLALAFFICIVFPIVWALGYFKGVNKRA